MVNSRLLFTTREEKFPVVVRTRRKTIAVTILILAELSVMMGVYASLLEIEGALENISKYRDHFGTYPPSEIQFLLQWSIGCIICAVLAWYLPRYIFRAGRKRVRIEVSSTPGFENLEA